MLTLNRLIQRVAPSPTLAAGARAQELKAAGRDIVSFTVGEPDSDTPQHVKDAATEAMKKGFTKYTAVGGIPSLKETIRAKLKRDQGLEYAANEICVTNGGKHAIAGLAAVLLDPGDEAIIPAPYWTSYPDIVQLIGGVSVIVNTDPKSGYRMTPEALEKAITPKTKLVFLNSPSNPTGACYSKEEILALGKVISASSNKSLMVLSDEVYEYITFDGVEHHSIAALCPELREQIVIVNAFSKAYSMTGWRVGYAAGPKKLIDALTTHQSQFTSNICSIAQHAAAAAYTDNGAFPKMLREGFQQRVKIVTDAVKEMNGVTLPVPPEGAFYAFLRVEGLFGKKDGTRVINSGMDFANYLLEKYDVVVVQGEAFGDSGAVRISYALAEADLKKGLARIIEATRTLQ
ncbi:MAG: pyridoxal phosphate-dependent aminotransferase [Deltaproteobacteria bacterium]|nr:pyridoxal phosphate-dependent aminotransferase [Deltaproteobacteria bacterium]